MLLDESLAAQLEPLDRGSEIAQLRRSAIPA